MGSSSSRTPADSTPPTICDTCTWRGARGGSVCVGRQGGAHARRARAAPAHIHGSKPRPPGILMRPNPPTAARPHLVVLPRHERREVVPRLVQPHGARGDAAQHVAQVGGARLRVLHAWGAWGLEGIRGYKRV